MHIFKSIHNGYIPLEIVENEKKELKEELGHTKQGNPKNRSEEQQITIDTIENLHNPRQEVAKMLNAYARNMSRNIYDSKQKGTGL